jgi:hypothetical protein
VVVVSEGADPNADSIPAIFDALLQDVPHRFVDGRTMAVFPDDTATVILWPGAYASYSLYQQWAGGRWSDVVALRVGEGEARLAAGSGATLQIPVLREASALLSNGVEVLGSGGDALRWELWWRAPGPLEGEDFHAFAHLYDAGGARVAQVDQATYGSSDWRVGDIVVTYFVLRGEGALVRSGMYAYPSLAPVAVLDGQGNPAGEWIEFELAGP